MKRCEAADYYAIYASKSHNVRHELLNINSQFRSMILRKNIAYCNTTYCQNFMGNLACDFTQNL